MNAFTWLWIAWGVMFGVVEGVALRYYPDRPDRPRTLSAHIWWIVKGRGLGHRLGRIAVLFLLVWLLVHLLTGGWV